MGRSRPAEEPVVVVCCCDCAGTGNMHSSRQNRRSTRQQARSQTETLTAVHQADKMSVHTVAAWNKLAAGSCAHGGSSKFVACCCTGCRQALNNAGITMHSHRLGVGKPYEGGHWMSQRTGAFRNSIISNQSTLRSGLTGQIKSNASLRRRYVSQVCSCTELIFVFLSSKISQITAPHAIF